jgi:ElaA protein
MTVHWQTSVFEALNTLELYALLQLRQEVFVVEQACVYQDLDGMDLNATHILCWEDKRLLAYQRCMAPGVSFPDSAIGRIVVAPAARGRRIGRELVQRGIQYNLTHWPNSAIQIGAQAYLEAFYTSLGFVSQNDQYIEDGIPHLHMIWSSDQQ